MPFPAGLLVIWDAPRMKKEKSTQSEFTEAEIHRRATAALARALSTPHKPHKPLKKAAKKNAKKPRG
jgi:hypothetical protein